MKSPIVPFFLIFALGIGLIFFLSLHGVDKKEEIAKENSDEPTEEVEAGGEFNAEEVAQGKCISCHGGDLEGGIGPALAGTSLSHDEIVDVIQNGGAGMPPGLVDDANLDAMADYLLSLK